MNYGMGGIISAHVDAFGAEDDPKLIEEGGPRIITFMTYLSSVKAGGRTVFPQLGISVKPVQGSALYWFNVHPDFQMDSRNLHLGCPMLFGNKWIANKWIKWFANHENYPCSILKNNFSIMNDLLEE